MDKINRFQSIYILLAVLLGLLLGQRAGISELAGSLIIPFLMLMLFSLFLGVSMKELRRAFLNIRFTVVNLLINFVWTPLFAYTLGYLFLSNEWPLWVGFFMLMVTPCTDWYLVFTGIAKGNLNLSTAVLPVNLLVQVLLLPIYLLLFFGQSGHLALDTLTESIVLVLVLPFICAWIVKRIATKTASVYRVSRILEQLQGIFLSMAVVVIFASEGKLFLDNPQVVLKLLIPIGIFFVVTFLISQRISKAIGFKDADRVSLIFTTMARNSPIALTIAAVSFPDQPFVVLALVIGPLIELPVLFMTSQFLLRSTHRK